MDIVTTEAPAPAGHYVQARAHQGVLYISGQLPLRADGSRDPSAPLEVQIRHALHNLLAIVRAGGSAPEHLLKITVYLVGVANWPLFDALFAEIMGPCRPARSVVPVPELHYGFLLELDAIAAIP